MPLYFSLCPALYFTARGQGILRDLDDMLTKTTNIEALIAVLFMIASFATAIEVNAGPQYCHMYTDWVHSVVALSTTAVGLSLVAIIVLLWYWPRFYAAVSRALVGAEAPQQTGRATIFGSMRFPVSEGAMQLKEKLKTEKNIELIIIDERPGGDISDAVFEGIEIADMFLVFGTANYGEDTPNPANSCRESKVTLSLNIDQYTYAYCANSTHLMFDLLLHTVCTKHRETHYFAP
eukprot:COSAG01_NODE_12536_length_1723_cov_1.489532_1_plen_234_part_10